MDLSVISPCASAIVSTGSAGWTSWPRRGASSARPAGRAWWTSAVRSGGTVSGILVSMVDWKVVIDTVSPRLFEAAAFHCTLIQHEGEYAGILQPERHYIRVRRDYSNIQDVVERVKDAAYCREIASNAHRDLIASGTYSYRAFVARFDRALAAHTGPPARRRNVSQFRFYARNFVWHDQAIIPYRDRFAILPSRKLAGALVRRGLSKLPRERFGAVGSRLIENPGEFFVKAYVSTRIGLRVPALRALMWRYFMDEALRRRIGYHELMNDLLKLDNVVGLRCGVGRGDADQLGPKR
ncbi:MAG: glycosyltransferase family 1 protein [Bacillati bacterium ANGP1]|uniref:Glycosyltransferase family 1 protein n=1 Tax=Candidatus Segetimicrobium genomatis TaxID=2569760 RepID=A0A537KPV1_9BACT|nr:MAG: glycosyltransferase family 1 protein [Terrabacteria group bacterium ANGP1]